MGMFAAFVGPSAYCVSPDFKFVGDPKHQPFHNERFVLERPETGEVSVPGDVSVIRELTRICSSHWGTCWKDGFLQAAEDKLQLAGIHELQFGVTQTIAKCYGLKPGTAVR